MRGGVEFVPYLLIVSLSCGFSVGEEVFRRILEERGLEWKSEEFLGWTHISIYRLGHKFTDWKSHGYKAEYPM